MSYYCVCDSCNNLMRRRTRFSIFRFPSRRLRRRIMPLSRPVRALTNGIRLHHFYKYDLSGKTRPGPRITYFVVCKYSDFSAIAYGVAAVAAVFSTGFSDIPLRIRFSGAETADPAAVRLRFRRASAGDSAVRLSGGCGSEAAPTATAESAARGRRAAHSGGR